MDYSKRDKKGYPSDMDHARNAFVDWSTDRINKLIESHLDENEVARLTIKVNLSEIDLMLWELKCRYNLS